MAFDPKELVGASSSFDAKTPRIWTYKSPDGYGATVADDYFASDPQRLKAGDLIFAYTTDNENSVLAVKSATTSATHCTVLVSDD